MNQGHPRRWAILAVLCMAVFVVSIDVTVLNVALPSLAVDLDATSSQLQWIIDAYSLTLAGLLLTAGSLSDRYGRKRMLLFGLVIFGFASAAAAFASTPTPLIIARCVMGAGAAFFMPGTLSILVQVFSAEERPKAIGVWGAVTALGVVAGPLLGGFLLDHYWWGSVFLINVGVVVVGVLGVALLVPESSDPRAHRPDVPGAVLSMAGLVGITYAIIEVPREGWTSPVVLGAAGAGAALLALFVLRQATARHPMLDLKLLRSRRFLGASGTMAVLMFVVTGSLFVMTQQFQIVLGYSPLHAGVAFLPVALSIMVVSPLSPLIAKTLGIRVAVPLGLLVVAAGVTVMAVFAPHGGYLPLAGALVLVGIGLGLSQAPANDALMSAAPTERSGLVSSMNDTVQELGAALGVAVIGSVLSAAYSSSFGLTGAGRAGDSLSEAAAQAATAPGGTDEALLQAGKDAFAHAMSVSMVWCAVIAAAGALLVALLLPRGIKAPDASHPADPASGIAGYATADAPVSAPAGSSVSAPRDLELLSAGSGRHTRQEGGTTVALVATRGRHRR